MQSSCSPFFLEKIANMFNEEERIVFLEESEKKRPVVIRVNTLKTTKKELVKNLSQRGMAIENLDFYNSCLTIYDSKVPIGATPEYLDGWYYIQGASSILSVINLDVKEHMSVLDMCASPGGKSTFIAEMMKNTGMLYLVENNPDRISSLAGNLLRMGVQNSVVINMNVLELEIEKVDRVLLDAPCSGTGTISKDGKAKTLAEDDLRRYAETQKKLILKGFDSLKGNGIMIYSTCSVLADENECVVEYLLRKRKNAKILECEGNVGKRGFTAFRGMFFDAKMKYARRIFPHIHNMDGFFFVKILKA